MRHGPVLSPGPFPVRFPGTLSPSLSCPQSFPHPAPGDPVPILILPWGPGPHPCPAVEDPLPILILLSAASLSCPWGPHPNPCPAPEHPVPILPTSCPCEPGSHPHPCLALSSLPILPLGAPVSNLSLWCPLPHPLLVTLAPQCTVPLFKGQPLGTGVQLMEPFTSLQCGSVPQSPAPHHAS